MNQNTVSGTISLEGFGAFATFASDLQKALDAKQTAVALDTPKVYGARTATKPVEAKAPSGPMPDLPKPVIGTKARNPNFGVEDLKRLRGAIYRKALDAGLKERDAKLYAMRFVMKIVLTEHTKNLAFEAMRDEIEAGVIEALVDEEKAFAWLRATRKEIEAELAAPKPAVARPAPKPAPVAPMAPVVELPPKYDETQIKGLVGETTTTEQLDRVAQGIIGLLKGDDRYEPGERNELMAYTRDMVVGRAMALGFCLRDAESTADATLGALPRKPRAVTTTKPARVETLPVKANATPVVNAKPLTKEELVALVAPVVEVSQETAKPKREEKPLRMEQLGKKVAADQQHAVEKAERMAREAERIAKAKQFADDLKAGAQPPLAPKPPKKEKGGDKKGRKGKGPNAEARA